MVIQQGDIFWVNVGRPRGSEPGYRHPYLVVQSDRFNRSAINTIVCCQITSNLRLAHAPGNVALSKDEANLPKRSVVNVTQMIALDRTALVEKVGTISRRRLDEVLAGLALLFDPGSP